MDSNTTIVEANLNTFNTMLRVMNPELWMLQQQIQETGVPVRALLKASEELYNIAVRSGFGKVIIHVQDGLATQVRGEVTHVIDEPIRIRESVVAYASVSEVQTNE